MSLFAAPTITIDSRIDGDSPSTIADDVRAGAFPSSAESYPLPADAAAELNLPAPAGVEKTEKP